MRYENEFLLHENVQSKICNSSSTDFFELFFSMELKKYIIEATCCNGYNLIIDDFDVFLGISILSIFNEKKSQRDY